MELCLAGAGARPQRPRRLRLELRQEPGHPRTVCAWAWPRAYPLTCVHTHAHTHAHTPALFSYLFMVRRGRARTCERNNPCLILFFIAHFCLSATFRSPRSLARSVPSQCPPRCQVRLAGKETGDLTALTSLVPHADRLGPPVRQRLAVRVPALRGAASPGGVRPRGAWWAIDGAAGVCVPGYGPAGYCRSTAVSIHPCTIMSAALRIVARAPPQRTAESWSGPCAGAAGGYCNGGSYSGLGR